MQLVGGELEEAQEINLYPLGWSGDGREERARNRFSAGPAGVRWSMIIRALEGGAPEKWVGGSWVCPRGVEERVAPISDPVSSPVRGRLRRAPSHLVNPSSEWGLYGGVNGGGILYDGSNGGWRGKIASRR